MTSESIVVKGDRAYAGQAPYTKLGLHGYDLLVGWVSFPLLWRCPRSRLMRFFDEHVSRRHLDVGVGSGYFLDHCRFPVSKPDITLMDLNANSLRHTADRLRRFAPKTRQANALEPWELPDAPFETVSMMNLLHCLPGSMREKKPALAGARSVLGPGGKLFGTTVLGEGVETRSLGRLGLRAANRIMGFGNTHDNPEDLEAGLAESFDSYELELQGLMAIFVGHVEA